MFVLQTITGSTYMITERQHAEIKKYIESGTKCFYIGHSLVVTHQISGIDPLETHQRQVKFKLSSKGLRMCSRCTNVIPLNDRCPCAEKPEKYPSILEVARNENPAIAAALDEIASRKAIEQSNSVDTVR